jgi:hypothetical protein
MGPVVVSSMAATAGVGSGCTRGGCGSSWRRHQHGGGLARRATGARIRGSGSGEAGASGAWGAGAVGGSRRGCRAARTSGSDAAGRAPDARVRPFLARRRRGLVRGRAARPRDAEVRGADDMMGGLQEPLAARARERRGGERKGS